MPRKKQRRDVAKARTLRADMSLPEVLLWCELRQHSEVKFRRQHPVGPYVLDFYCASVKVGIEIDGIAHDMGDRPERDAKRDRWLSEQGIEVIRIPASDVLGSPSDIAEALISRCRRQCPSVSRLRRLPPPHLR